MNFADLCAEVYKLTNRPDLVNETQLAVKSATLRAHRLDFFPKDLYENSYQFETCCYEQQLPTALIPNYRAIKYLRKYYPCTSIQNPLGGVITTGGRDNGIYNSGYNLPDGNFFDVVDAKNVLDGYARNKVDVAYLAGNQFQLRSGDGFQFLLVGAYVNPDITETGWNSWVGNEYPYAIVFDATSIVFKTIGFDEQNAAYDALKKLEWTELQNANILAEGS